MNVRLTRRAVFSAGHSYYLSNLSEEDNKRIYGANISEFGHGHNYSVAITVAGEVDKQSGIVVNITEIDKALKSNVISVLDGTFLNKQVSFFQTNPPTTENITRFVRQELDTKLPVQSELVKVHVSESETLWSTWESSRPDEHNKPTTMGAVQLTRKYDFSAAHRLHSNNLTADENIALFGKCNHPNFHGHNYDIEVTLAGTPDPVSGMLYDLGKLDSIVSEHVLLPMDHRNLNLDIQEFADINPTSEMLAVVIWNRLSKHIPTSGDPKLAKVLVRETARNEFEYSGD
jgi:6-pyruvoyltetrahydropterin/6-carboxytetrahydropterin synthase